MNTAASATTKSSSLRYWTVGIGLIAIAISGFWPQSPIRPQGALAQVMESELRTLSAQLGTEVAGDGCTMSGNLNLGVNCRVVPYSLDAAKAKLHGTGWKQTAITPLASETEHAAFVKADRYLSLDASSSQNLWVLSMRYRRE